MNAARTRLVGIVVAALAIVASIVLIWVNADDGDAPAGGEAAPDVAFEMFDGSQASISDYEGRPLVINFWASWCPPCIAEMPDLETVHREVADEVDFLGINTQDRPEAAAELVEQTGVTYDLARDPDGEVFREFGVFGMPTTLFVSAEGRIVHRHTGVLTEDEVRDLVDEHLRT